MAKRAGLLFMAGALLLGLALLAWADNPKEDYKKARALFQQGDNDAAIPLFEKVVKGFPVLADHATYYLGEIFFRKKDWPAAKRSFEGLLTAFPDSVWLERARLRLGDILLETGRPLEAAASYGGFLAVFPGSPLVPEVLLRQGRAYLRGGEKTEAYLTWQKLWLEFPLAGQAKEARKSMDDLNRGQVKREPPLEDWLKRATLLYEARRYNEAQADLKGILASPGLSQWPALHRWALLRLGMTLAREGQYEEALKALKKVGESFPQSEEAGAALYWQGRVAIRQNQRPLARQLLTRLVADFPKAEEASRALLLLASLAKEENDLLEALRFYDQLIKEYPSSPDALTARWQTGWIFYLKEYFSQAAASFRQLAQSAPDPFAQEQASYWLGRSLEKMGEGQQARQLYQELVKRAPLTYYGTRAEARLAALWPRESGEPNPAESGPGSNFPSTLTDHPWVEKARVLVDLALTSDARIELYRLIRETGFGAKALGLILPTSQLFARLGDYHRSHSIIRQFFASNIKLWPEKGDKAIYWQMAYPQAFLEIVVPYARRYGLSPSLVFSVMREESAFDPGALSRSGAIGLMQVIPPTGRIIARELGLRPFSPSLLYHPSLNVRFGIWYLARLKEQFNGDELLAIAAYNAGPQTVTIWLAKLGYSDPDEFVESIPFEETRGYVRRVLKSKFAYRATYGP